MPKIHKQGKKPNVKLKSDDYAYPIFCFKYLQSVSIKKCENMSLYESFFERLNKLSQLGWEAISKSEHHSYGWEFIPLKKIKCCNSLKNLDIITNHINKLMVFRCAGNKLPFLGLRKNNIFHVVLIETTF